MSVLRRAAVILATIACVLATGAGAYADDAPHAFRHANPGNVDHYVLVLSWSPTHCLKKGDARDDWPCDDDQSQDFVLHGWWP